MKTRGIVTDAAIFSAPLVLPSRYRTKTVSNLWIENTFIGHDAPECA